MLLWGANLALLAALAFVVANDLDPSGPTAAGAERTDAALAGVAPEPSGAAAALRLGRAGSTAPVPARFERALDPQLERAVERAIANAVERAEKGTQGRVNARNVTVGVSIVDVDRRAVRVARLADVALRPASSQKLVTTAAALALLGPDGAFETSLEHTGTVADGRLAGDLIVRAGGDPLIGDERGRVSARFEAFVRALDAAGIRTVGGDLILDERSFPEPAPGPAWPDASQHWQDYCALAGGLSVHGGCLVATVRAGSVGGAARVEVHPRDHGLRNEWKVTTKSKGALVIGLEARAGRVLVRGSIPKNVPEWSDAFAHPDPVALFASTLRAELARAGVRIEGTTVRRRDVPPAATIGRVETPIVDVLEPINTHSWNSVADQLFLATGLATVGDASRAGGARATRRALERLGVSTQGFLQVDGSGLSRDNRISAEQLTALLVAVRDGGGGLFEHLKSSLAVAGETGTLERRMRGTRAAGRVFAKTGFIGGTSALAGYAAAGARTHAFAILVDYPVHGGLNTSCWKPMQDEICAALCEDGGQDG